MARYTGPKTKIARKFGEAIFGADKVLSKKNYPPGQHGNNRRRKTSEYGVQLREKQKAKYTYNMGIGDGTFMASRCHKPRNVGNIRHKPNKSSMKTGEPAHHMA